MPKPKPIRPPKTHERSWGEGTVKEVSPGVWRSWRARVHTASGSSTRASRRFKGENAEQRARAWASGAVEPAVMLLGQWLVRWLALTEPTVEPSTAHNYSVAIDECAPLAARPLAEVTTEEWQALTNNLLTRWSRYHVAVWRQILSVALRSAMPRYITVNPLARVRLPKPDEQPPKAWRQDEIDRLLNSAAGHHHEPWLLFSLGTGVRIGEARALLLDDLHLATKTATIRASLDSRTNRRGPTKTKRVRVTDIPDEVLPILSAHIKRQPPGTTHVFGNGKRAFAASSLRQWLRRTCKAAKVRELPPHSLRHTYASLALDAGVPVQDVARQLGHSVSMTQKTYSHYIGDGQRRAANALGKALRHRFSGPKRAIGSENGTGS